MAHTMGGSTIFFIIRRGPVLARLAAVRKRVRRSKGIWSALIAARARLATARRGHIANGNASQESSK